MRGAAAQDQRKMVRDGTTKGHLTEWVQSLYCCTVKGHLPEWVQSLYCCTAKVHLPEWVQSLYCCTVKGHLPEQCKACTAAQPRCTCQSGRKACTAAQFRGTCQSGCKACTAAQPRGTWQSGRKACTAAQLCRPIRPASQSYTHTQSEGQLKRSQNACLPHSVPAELQLRRGTHSAFAKVCIAWYAVNDDSDTLSSAAVTLYHP